MLQTKSLGLVTKLALFSTLMWIIPSSPVHASYTTITLNEGWKCEGNFSGNSGNGLCVQRETVDPGSPYQYYRGDVQNGTFTGRGVLVYDNSDRYEGQMRNGRPNGKGAFIKVSASERYTGDFRNGEFHGQGLYVFGNGAKYQGQFAGSQPHGRGTFTFRDDQARKTYTYQGRFYLGVVNGNGTITSSDNIVCNGVFYGNDFAGNGRCIYPSNHPSGFRSYDGHLKNGLPDGRGTAIYQDGRSFSGEFRKGEALPL
jgi:hypothetical protein